MNSDLFATKYIIIMTSVTTVVRLLLFICCYSVQRKLRFRVVAILMLFNDCIESILDHCVLRYNRRIQQVLLLLGL